MPDCVEEETHLCLCDQLQSRRQAASRGELEESKCSQSQSKDIKSSVVLSGLAEHTETGAEVLHLSGLRRLKGFLYWLLLDDCEQEPPLSKKKPLPWPEPRLDRNQSDRSLGAAQHEEPQTRFGGSSFKREACGARRERYLTDTTFLSEQTSSWADTQNAEKKVLEHLISKQATNDFFLDGSVNKRFLEFYQDVTDECGTEDKQHSWAVLEKPEEVIIYGPYYPNYTSGEHSEDIIVKQTQDLLESEGVPKGWKVFVFTLNSPCLARNTDPCMLKLVHEAQEWWSMFGVKTHIGFVRCWGFKGKKKRICSRMSATDKWNVSTKM
ncbi:uncharacterized protein KZ484_013174 [Pholidichthys leucotaenia]